MFSHFRLFKNKTFALFFAGNAISLIGWGFNFIAVGWIVIDLTGSEIALGQLNALATLPGLVIAIYAGTIIDRMNRKHLLVTLDIIRMLAVIAIPILMWTQHFALWNIYTMAFIIGLGSSMFWPTASAFTQEIVGEKDYLAANSLLSASYQSGSLLGSALGGFIIHWFGADIALFLDACTYLISSTLIGLATHTTSVEISEHEKIRDTFRGGFSYIRRHKLLFGFSSSTVFADVAIWGNFTVLTIAFSVNVLDAGARGFGLLDGAYGIGALLSSFLAILFARKFRNHLLLMVAYGIAALCCLALPYIPILAVSMILFLIIGVHNNSARIISRTIIMENVPNKVMGRFQTIVGVLTRFLIIISTLLMGWIVEKYSVSLGLQSTMLWFLISMVGVIVTYSLNPNLFNKIDLKF